MRGLRRSGLPSPGVKSQGEQLRHWQENRRKLAFSTVGTPDYIAPEVLMKKARTHRRATVPSAAWDMLANIFLSCC